MKTVLVSGGTKGIGRGLVLSLLGSGDRVIAVGSAAANGAALVDEATRLGIADGSRSSGPTSARLPVRWR
ncbi:hypothetical protein AB0J90_01450 [Micromonospora sp. NPDC049523]|uniref:hypothetical protein n=1 Tax=Micromonospora sp. NPDC049523 TaxID=3155921 RepID=UPI0034213265